MLLGRPKRFGVGGIVKAVLPSRCECMLKCSPPKVGVSQCPVHGDKELKKYAGKGR